MEVPKPRPKVLYKVATCHLKVLLLKPISSPSCKKFGRSSTLGLDCIIYLDKQHTLNFFFQVASYIVFEY